MTVTRAERQARTRETLVAVARDLFLGHGFAPTSLDRVADEAGFSKGAVYSNFAGKEELGLAVLDQIHDEQVAEVAGLWEHSHTVDERLVALGGWARDRIGRPRETALEVELAAVARHSTYVAQALATRNADLRAAIAALVRTSAEELGIESELAPEQVATVLLGLGIGLGALRSIDTSVSTDLFVATLRHLFGVPYPGPGAV